MNYSNDKTILVPKDTHTLKCICGSKYHFYGDDVKVGIINRYLHFGVKCSNCNRLYVKKV